MVLNQSQLLRILSHLSTQMFHVEHYALTFHVEHYVVLAPLVPRSETKLGVQRSFQIELWVPQGKAWVSLMFHVEHLRASKEKAK